MILLPIVSYSAFCNDYPNLNNELERQHYYKEQCAIKWIFGIKAKIRFI
jgi:hypothetical protein